MYKNAKVTLTRLVTKWTISYERFGNKPNQTECK